MLLTGPSGSGKSMLVEATSQRFGVRYMRVDCVTVGGAAPGLGEAKLKAVFDQLKKLSPCILQLSDIEVSIINFEILYKYLGYDILTAREYFTFYST